MFVFVCSRCAAELTTPLSQVSLPVHARQVYGNGAQMPVLMESGTFAVDPDPSGPPWRPWGDVEPVEAEARGIYAPLHSVPYGAPGAVVIAPGDIRGTRLIPEKGGGSCCGLDGSEGPNMACQTCNLAVASRIDDCSRWQAVWLAPDAVRRLHIDAPEAEPLSWEALLAERRSTPPLEPIGRWGSSPGSIHYWYWAWSPQWEAAAGHALAHLLAASERRPVKVQSGLIAEVFQRTLDVLLPVGPPERHAVLAGPGQSAPDASADILLVPVHPQTGRIWTPVGPAAPDYLVPLPLGVWLWMALPQPYLPAPASGRIPDDVLRDEPLPPRPNYLFRADWETFRQTLVRLPAVRSPWLRAILEDLGEPRSAYLI